MPYINHSRSEQAMPYIHGPPCPSCASDTIWSEATPSGRHVCACGYAVDRTWWATHSPQCKQHCPYCGVTRNTNKCNDCKDMMTCTTCGAHIQEVKEEPKEFTCTVCSAKKIGMVYECCHDDDNGQHLTHEVCVDCTVRCHSCGTRFCASYLGQCATCTIFTCQTCLLTSPSGKVCASCFSRLFIHCRLCNRTSSKSSEKRCLLCSERQCIACSHDDDGRWLCRPCAQNHRWCSHCTDYHESGRRNACPRARRLLNVSQTIYIEAVWSLGTKTKPYPDGFPTLRPMGMELEVCHPDNDFSKIHVPAFWQVVSDGSLAHEGWEFVSPVMSGDAAVRHVGAIAKEFDGARIKIDQCAGYHLHLGVDHSDWKTMRNFTLAFAHFQPLFVAMQPESRRNGNRYCAPLEPSWVTEQVAGIDGFPQAAINMYYPAHSYGWKKMKKEDKARYWHNINSIIREKGHPSRYHALNLHSWFHRGSLEVRLHTGTMDRTKIYNWAYLMLATMERAAREENAVELLTPNKWNVSTAMRARLWGQFVEWMGSDLPDGLRDYMRERMKKFGWDPSPSVAASVGHDNANDAF